MRRMLFGFCLLVYPWFFGNAAESERVVVINGEEITADEERIVIEAPSIEVIELQLDDARERLADAAREIAELSVRLDGNSVAEALSGLQIELGQRAMLGVNIAGRRSKVQDGVEIVGVSPGGPAEQAGLETGDVLLSVNGQSLAAEADESPSAKLLAFMRDIKPGDEVQVEYRRADRTNQTTVVTEEFGSRVVDLGGAMPFVEFDDLPEFDTAPFIYWRGSHLWGDMELVSLTPQLGTYFGVDEGLLVVRAPKDNDLGLEDGDVIVGIDGRRPEDPGHAMRILDSYEPGNTLSLDVFRHRQSMTLTAQMPERTDQEHGKRIYRYKFRTNESDSDAES